MTESKGLIYLLSYSLLVILFSITIITTFGYNYVKWFLLSNFQTCNYIISYQYLTKRGLVKPLLVRYCELTITIVIVNSQYLNKRGVSYS